jgi:diguanylate cyclase (GGDEF)-like protein/PAS domain S-box-containing protein
LDPLLKSQVNAGDRPDGAVGRAWLAGGEGVGSGGGLDAGFPASPPGPVPPGSATEPVAEPGQTLSAELQARIARLQLSNERFAGAIESLSHGLCIYDGQHRLVASNRRYGELYDLPPEKLVPGVHLLEVVGDAASRGVYRDGRTLEDAADALAEIAERGSCERTRQLANGQVVQISFNRLADGGWIALHKDITDKMLAEQRLEESNQRFRDFADAAADWCWETDAEHRFVDPDTFMGRRATFGSSAYIGKRRIDLPLVDGDRPVLEAHMRDLAFRRPFKDMLYRVPNEDGSIAWIKASGKPVFDSSGVFTGYRGSARNVSDDMVRREILARQQFALQRASDVAKLGYWRWTAADASFEWSESVFVMLGFGPDERVPDLRKLVAKVCEQDRKPLVAALKELEGGRIMPDQDYRFQREPGGEVRYFQLRVDLEHDAAGRFAGTFGIIQDITDLKLAETRLRERSEQLLEAQKLGRIGDWSYQFGAGEIWWSPEIFALMGYSGATFVPTRAAVMGLYQGDGAQRLLDAQSDVVRNRGIRTVDVKGLRGDGSIGDFAVTSKAVVDPAGQVIGFAGTIQDISERKQAEEQLEKLAYYDPLTGLANRALFRREIDEVLDRAQRTRQPAALLLLDLDRFKEVNDSLGHAAGDELLGKVGHSISRIIGQECFLARLGGDEFAVIVRDAGGQGLVERIASEVIAALNQPFGLERGEVHIGTSIGVVMIPRDGSDSEELLRHADLALYRAKEGGRGRLAFFKPDMNDLVQQKTALARDLRHAVAGNLGLEARYQPQVDLASNRVSGFETLMRWKHPTRGYVPPNEFIPIAESSSLICDLGLWIMRESAVQAKLWLDLGEPPRELSVNVSAAQIWQTELEVDVARILDETGLPPHLLCLELTESLFADHAEGRVRRALTALKKLGVTLALDDFGTGYSSLGYLTQLPFDKLKIDRCFIDGIVEQPRKRKLLQGMIALGRGLGMTVVAEGAEKDEELAILRGFGCDTVQGFVFAKPTIASEAISFAHACEEANKAEPGSLVGQLRKILARAG